MATWIRFQHDNKEKIGTRNNGNISVYEGDIFDVSFCLKNFLANRDVLFQDTDVSLSLANNSQGKVETLPMTWLLSPRLFWGSFSFMGQLKSLSYYAVMLKSAAITWDPSFITFLSLSMGYSEFHEIQRIEEDVNDNSIFSSVTYGVGLYLFGANFDYAFEQGDHVDSKFRNRHYFSVNFYY